MYRNCRMNVDCNKRKVVLELSPICNLNCKHCIYKSLNKISFLDFIAKEDAFRLIDKFSFAKIDRLVLTGGEPTLHPYFSEISEYAIKKIPKVSICTNGVIFNKKLEKKVIAFNFSNYTVSVDSHIEEIHDEFRGVKGAFNQTISFLEKLKDKEKRTAIHITLNPTNIDHIEETIKFCKKFSDEVAVGTIYHNFPSNDKKLEKDYKDHSEKVKKFKTKFTKDPSVILIGFTQFCENKNCLDLKNVFMVNYKGKIVSCYWKKNKGKIVKISSKDKFFEVKI